MVQKCSVAIPEQTAILKEKKHLTQDVMLLSFEITSPFTFDAGQYVIIKIIQDTDFRMKSYSILNPPSEKGKLELCAKLIPGGFASENTRRNGCRLRVHGRGADHGLAACAIS